MCAIAGSFAKAVTPIHRQMWRVNKILGGSSDEMDVIEGLDRMDEDMGGTKAH